MAAPRIDYARSGDVHLAYQVIGDGPRDIVLVLDWASHLEVLWEQPFVVDFASALARYTRVIWFDMRGVGLSDRGADRTVPPEVWVEDVGAVMAAAGSERATIVAHGHGTQLAVLFAAIRPERVESLVLLNGYARLARADDYPFGLPPEAQAKVLEAIDRDWGTGSAGRLQALAPSIADRPGVAEWWARAERHAASPGAALAMTQATFALDVREALPLVAAPTLVVHNRGNAVVRSDHGRYLAEHIPGARLLERASADHWPLPEPDLLAAIEEFVTGDRVVADESDRFLATVLVVDVAGSTERVSELGDRSWSLARDRFEDVVRRSLVTFGGDLVDVAGDGVLATFPGPARAIRCAVQVQGTLARSGLAVRCGLHAGEVQRRPGGVAGLAVHITARVAALAEPGEVLVTRTVRDLVAGSSLAFVDRGAHRLKGVPDTWTLYAASA